MLIHGKAKCDEPKNIIKFWHHKYTKFRLKVNPLYVTVTNFGSRRNNMQTVHGISHPILGERCIQFWFPFESYLILVTA